MSKNLKKGKKKKANKKLHNVFKKVLIFFPKTIIIEKRKCKNL